MPDLSVPESEQLKISKQPYFYKLFDIFNQSLRKIDKQGFLNQRT